MIRFINLFSKLSFKKNYDIIIIKKQYGLDARHLYALLSSNEKWSEILSRAHKLQVQGSQASSMSVMLALFNCG